MSSLLKFLLDVQMFLKLVPFVRLAYNKHVIDMPFWEKFLIDNVIFQCENLLFSVTKESLKN